jgi:hypothetical protein
MGANRIDLTVRDAAGGFYGVCTLIQLVQQFGATLPALAIEDYPDLPNRGVMLDISRDRVPTMETLYTLVDRLAGWKVNQLQLYTEHTFAYRQHGDVWANASPMTAEEVLALDAYCRERFVELVPNQNSFGHMERWLKHERYRPLAETDAGFVTPWGDYWDHPYSLAPTNPASLELLERLYDELLPNFTSRQFNVGCDETFDLGQGRSKALVESRGRGRVYLDFLIGIYERVQARGRTMQFWGDIIGHYPELVKEVPHDAIALEWWYESNADYAAAQESAGDVDWQEQASHVERKCAAYAEADIPFYVCPGTSSWNSLAGRVNNAVGNIREMVETGLQYGAQGVLNTDWGDGGHWQPLPVSYAGFAYAAGVGWAHRANVDMALPAVLDAFAFEDSAGIMGKLAVDLGSVYRLPGVALSNSSVLFAAYQYPLDLMTAEASGVAAKRKQRLACVENLLGKLSATIAAIDETIVRIDGAHMARADADLIAAEYRLVADMLKHGARRLLLIVGDSSVKRADLAAELEAIEARFRLNWLARSRPGGLEDSAGRIAAARRDYSA